MSKRKLTFVIITGMSGAGKSLTIKCLEDIGYFCVDNIPAALLPKFSELFIYSKGEIDKIAIVVDVRDSNFIDDIQSSLKELKDMKLKYRIIFLEADTETLLRRFNESRRPHPLSKSRNIIDNIELEKKMLKTVKENADLIIDTSQYKIHDYKKYITKILRSEKKYSKLNINIISFGYKNGLPLNIDMLFDVRFLPNPFYVEKISNLNGNNKKVRNYVLKWSETRKFMKLIYKLMDFLIPLYINESRSYLTIGIGCTGGMHRSVVVSNELYKYFKKMKLDINPGLQHRELQ